MAVVFADGFDGYTGADPASPSAVNLASKYAITQQILPFTFVTGRYGGQAIRHPGNYTTRAKSPAFSSPVSSFTICMNVKPAFDADHAFGLLSGTTAMIGVVFNTSGGITIERATVAIASTANSLWVADGVTWHALKISVVIHDTTGSVVINLNGVEVLNATGLDTRNGTPTTVDNWMINDEGQGLASSIYDDVFVTDSATAPAGEFFIETIPVNADGATLDWVPSTGSDHFAVVDELPGSISDYLSASAVGEIDELEIGNFAISPATILAAQFVGHFDKTDGASRSVALGVKSGATTSAGTNAALTTAGSRVERLFNNDPDTSAAWTENAIEASKLRPEVTV